MSPPKTAIGTYNDGRAFKAAAGRYAPRHVVQDALAPAHPLFWLPTDKPSAQVFVDKVMRELKIRFDTQKSRKAYRLVLHSLFRWARRPPHELTREDVRDFLELLVDGGKSSSFVALHLSALRTAFDKLCQARRHREASHLPLPQTLVRDPSAREWYGHSVHSFERPARVGSPSTLPPLEQWQDAMRWLSPVQRARLESPEFCEFLRVALAKRFLARRPSGLKGRS
jgi:hypothetical protein